MVTDWFLRRRDHWYQQPGIVISLISVVLSLAALAMSATLVLGCW